MKVKLITEPFHYIHIEDLYSEDELKLIWMELDYFNSMDDRYIKANCENSALNDEGFPLKSNSGFYLDHAYCCMNMSNIFRLSRKILDPKVLNQKDSWFFKNIFINRDSTFISYYENDDFYLSHDDIALVSACTWIYKEPKIFSGGDFNFCDYDLKIEVKNNSCVIFPSRLFHSVDKVIIPDQYQNKGLGRYCISQFFNMG